MALETAHVETRLPAQDLERARRWYVEKLGLQPREERTGGLRYVLGDDILCLFQSAGQSDGSFRQLAFNVADIEQTVRELRERGVQFEEDDALPLLTHGSIAEIDGNYPSKGTGERAAWFRDSEGNMLGIGQPMGPKGGD